MSKFVVNRNLANRNSIKQGVNGNIFENQLNQQAEEFINTFEKEVMLDMLGDHMRVTIYRDGRAETEDYTDHD